MAKAEELPVKIVKPEADDREYEYLELPNGLRCVLVSDKEADKAAACMDVRCAHAVMSANPVACPCSRCSCVESAVATAPALPFHVMPLFGPGLPLFGRTCATIALPAVRTEGSQTSSSNLTSLPSASRTHRCTWARSLTRITCPDSRTSSSTCSSLARRSTRRCALPPLAAISLLFPPEQLLLACARPCASCAWATARSDIELLTSPNQSCCFGRCTSEPWSAGAMRKTAAPVLTPVPSFPPPLPTLRSSALACAQHSTLDPRRPPPQEGEYHEFLSAHGGAHNAYTAQEVGHSRHRLPRRRQPLRCCCRAAWQRALTLRWHGMPTAPHGRALEPRAALQTPTPLAPPTIHPPRPCPAVHPDCAGHCLLFRRRAVVPPRSARPFRPLLLAGAPSALWRALERARCAALRGSPGELLLARASPPRLGLRVRRLRSRRLRRDVARRAAPALPPGCASLRCAVQPLFSAGATARELSAVDSEHSNNLQVRRAAARAPCCARLRVHPRLPAPPRAPQLAGEAAAAAAACRPSDP